MWLDLDLDLKNQGLIWIAKYDSPLISAHGNTSSLRFRSDFLESSKCKVIFAAASFRNSAAYFLKTAWCSNLSKFSDSLVNIYFYLLIACNSYVGVSFHNSCCCGP